MRQLDTCDFCGDAPEGVYEVVPASVADAPKRLALCADCRGTLQSVVDPLLDAADAAPGGTGDASDAAAATRPGEHADELAPAESADPGTVLDDVVDAASESDAERGRDGREAERSGDEAPDRGGSDTADRSTGDAGDSRSGGDEGVVIQSGDADEEGATDATADDAGSDDAAGADDDAASDADSDDDAAADLASGGSPARRPNGYAQVVRLLQNRDGAMPREDLRTLATNAYDLGDSEFETAVDAAIEAGDVEETAEGLRTP